MLREHAIALLLAAAAIVCPSVQAQMRGSGRMSGHPVGVHAPNMGGFAGPRGGGFAGPRGGMFRSPGMHGPRFPVSNGPRRGFFPGRGGFAHAGRFPHRGTFFHEPFRHHHGRFPFFANTCFFNPLFCGGGFFGASAFWPGPIFGPDYYEPYNEPYNPPQEPATVQYAPDPYLHDQIERLTDEVESLRHEQQARDIRTLSSNPAPSTPEATTVLIFHDGKRLEVKNYGIAGQTLWIFNEQRATKFPLADLDVKATRTANELRGTEFVGPTQ